MRNLVIILIANKIKITVISVKSNFYPNSGSGDEVQADTYLTAMKDLEVLEIKIPEWEVGTWSNCSKQCGSGFMHR